eukprot:CAMPEP_0204364730 /NCGR_PEP_ID=MMETSP0469-20131031/41364_1 /ASSEMBLY_ACC=CAM_ASM_000384 /TAXON_ID=2969 /ORGANISM="Oxyrrhis marina" /LENGTH=114 /DNA_ID=CAMNT_0051353687 /DNA_START=112 /DNA_END=456 /DNA_ORIENTATION=+
MEGILKLRPRRRGWMHDTQGGLPTGIGRPELEDDRPLPGLRAQGGHLLQKRGLSGEKSGGSLWLHNALEVHHAAVVGGILALFWAQDQAGMVHCEPAVRGPLVDLKLCGISAGR